MMTRIVATLFFLFVFLAAAVLILPGVINWNRHKPEVSAFLSSYTARKVDVAGDISLHLLPDPRIRLEKVSVANITGAQSPHFLTLEKIDARLDMQALLQGRLEVDRLLLDDPALFLEISAEGTPNWRNVFKERPEGARTGSVAGRLRLKNVDITHGRILFKDVASGFSDELQNLSLVLSADSLLGPYVASGTGVWRRAPYKIALNRARLNADAIVPFQVEGMTEAKDMPDISVSGTFSPQGVSASLNISGTLNGLLSPGIAQALPFLTESAVITAEAKAAAQDWRISDIDAIFGGKGKLSGEVVRDPAISVISADLEGEGLRLNSSAAFMPVPQQPLKLEFKGRKLVWGMRAVPDVSMQAETAGDEWLVKTLRLGLPEKVTALLAGVVTPEKNFGGFTLRLDVPDLAAGIKNLSGVDASAALNAAAIKKISLSGNFDAYPDRFELNDIEGRADTHAFHGKAFYDGKLKLELSGAEGADAFKGSIGNKGIVVDDAQLSLKEGSLTAKGNAESLVVEFNGVAAKEIWQVLDLPLSSLPLASPQKAVITGGAVSLSAAGMDIESNREGRLKGQLSGAASENFLKELLPENYDLVRPLADISLTLDKENKESGQVVVKTDKLTVSRFNPAAVFEILATLQEMPEDIEAVLIGALSEGKATYDKIDFQLQLKDGSVNLDVLSLADENTKAEVSFDCKSVKCRQEVTATSLKHEGMPVLRIIRDEKKYTIEAEEVRAWLTEKVTPPVPGQPPQAAIQGILQRLEGEAAPPPEPAPVDLPAPEEESVETAPPQPLPEQFVPPLDPVTPLEMESEIFPME